MNNISGTITVATGPMRSRKTLDLIINAQMYDVVGLPTVVFYPSGSERYERAQRVYSRMVIGDDDTTLSYPAISLPRELDTIGSLVPSKPGFIGFDDAQFFTNKIVSVVQNLRSHGHKVFIAGLDMDCFLQPFGPMPFLMAVADQVIKHTAVCGDCLEPAQVSYRLAADVSQEYVGGDDDYIPLCFDCYHYRKNSYTM